MFRSLPLTLILCCLVCAVGVVVPGAPAVHADAPGYHWEATWGLPAAPGTLNRPTSLDVDSAGNIYVVDAGLDRVQVFQPDGTFLRSLGAAGVGPGELLNPVDVAVRGDLLYVADYDAGRTQVWTLQGAFVREISGNTGTGELMYTRRPEEVGADGSGRVFIAGYAGVLRYAADGTLEREYPAEPCAAYTERALAVLSTGVFFCPSMSGGLSRVALDGAAQIIGNVPGQPDYLGSVHMLATAPDDSVWGINGHTRQAHHLSAAGAYLGGFTLAEDALNLAATADRLYVLLADFTVAVYGWDGTRLAQWGQPAFTAAGSFDQPDRLAAAPDGTLYVLERGRRRIQHLDANGNILGVLNNDPASAANLDKPQDLVVDGAGRLHVLDGQRVLRFQNGLLDAVLPSGSYTGVFLSALTAFGDHRLTVTDSGAVWRANLDGMQTGGWQGDGFSDMAVDAAGSVYLLGQVQPPLVNAYTLTTGAVGATWGDRGRTGDAPGVFLQPTGIAADLRGQIIVLDADRRFGATVSTAPVFGSRVQVFTADGQHLTSFGSFGAGDGQMIGARSVAALADGRIVVADTENNRLQVFAPDSTLPPLTPLPAVTTYGPEASPLFASWIDQGPTGGTISVPYALAIGRPTVAIYGNGQLATTDDGGAHWRRIGAPQATHATWTNIFYAGKSTLIAQKSLYDAPYRSTDGGYTWTRLGNAFITGNSAYLTASPAYDTDGVLFASVYGGGFWRSTDRGSSWQRRGLVGENINAVAVAVNAGGQRTLLLNGGGKQYLGRQVGTNGLLRSTDDGATWQRVSPTNAVLAAFAFSPAFAADQAAFAVYGSGSNGYALYRSTDAGQTWNELGALPFPQGDSFLGLTFSPAYAADRSLIAWSSNSIYLSSDAGERWQAIGRAGDVRTPRIVAFGPTYAQTHAIWVCESTYDSRFRQTTDDGATWQPIGSGLPGAAIYGLAGAEAPEAAPPWALSNWGLLAADANGGNWAWFKTYGPARPDAQDVFVRSPAFAQDQTAIVFNAMTSDGGVTWRAINIPERPPYPDYNAAAFAPDFAVSQRILLAWEYCEYRQCQTYLVLTEDAGGTWRKLWQTSKLLAPAAIAFDARWPATPSIYLGGTGGVYKSTDGGQTWTAAGLEAQVVRGLVSRQEGGQHVLYAATRTAGVWRSLDDGATWAAWNTGLANGSACALSRSATGLAVGLCDGRAYLWSATLNAWQRVGARLPAGVNALLLDGDWPAGTLWAGTNDGIYRATLVEAPLHHIWLPVIMRGR